MTENLDAATDVLIAEFADRLPAMVVIEQLVRAWQQLLGAGVRAGVSLAAESMARMWLRSVSPWECGPLPASPALRSPRQTQGGLGRRPR